MTLLSSPLYGETSAGELRIKRDYLKEITPLSQDYKLGDHGPEVTMIEEWLMLWQLNENFASKVLRIEPDQKFDKDTQDIVLQVQKFLGLKETGIVDVPTWSAMVGPMRKAFELDSYTHKTLREKMKYFATKHLQYRAAELAENNMGPWVRAYMDDHEGEWYYWCAGFVSTIMDQSFSSIGEDFSEYYANSWLVEDHRKKARSNGLLVTHSDLETDAYVPQFGDMVVYISSKDKRGHHIEIVYEVLDPKTGAMLTVGGNTNFSGSSNGVGTFLVDRNFKANDVEIIKMIDQEAIDYNATNVPADARKLLRAYPNQIHRYADNKIYFDDGTSLVFDNGTTKTVKEMLENPDISDQFHFPYKTGAIKSPPGPHEDPGRITNQDFFKTIYGDSEEAVTGNLVEFVWAPAFGGGQKVKATRVNGIAKKLEAIGKELDDDPAMESFLTNIGGTFKWRYVAGTNRLSLHSFGIAIDLNVSQSSYWEWDCKCKDEDTKLAPHKNKIPQKIIDTFEKYGFIWGGKWYHYDTMHFEYRPELILN